MEDRAEHFVGAKVGLHEMANLQLCDTTLTV